MEKEVIRTIAKDLVTGAKKHDYYYLASELTKEEYKFLISCMGEENDKIIRKIEEDTRKQEREIDEFLMKSELSRREYYFPSSFGCA